MTSDGSQWITLTSEPGEGVGVPAILDLRVLDPEVVAIGPRIKIHIRDLVQGEPSEPNISELLNPVSEEDPELITHLLVIPGVLLLEPLLALLPGLFELLARVNLVVLPLPGVNPGILLDKHLFVKDFTLTCEDVGSRGVELLNSEDHELNEGLIGLSEVDEMSLGPIRHGREASSIGAPHVLEVESPTLVQVVLGDLSDLGDEGVLGDDVLSHLWPPSRL